MIKINWKNLITLVILFVSLLGSLFVWHKLAFINHSHFTDLAYSFLQGKLSLPEPLRYSSWQDSAYFGGKYYVYFGPVPAILLLPVVAAFGQNVSQQILVVFAGVINFFLLFKLSRKLGLKTEDALWLTMALLFGSVYLFLSLVNISAYLSQIVGFTFLLGAVTLSFSKRGWFWVGFLLALAGMSRYTLYFALPFFFFQIIQSKTEDQKLSLFKFILPILVSVVLLGLYNQMRFGNPLDTGYTYNTTWPPGVRQAVSNYGLFSLNHLPGNLYFLLLKGPEAVRTSELSYVLPFPFLRANEWGMGIVFTSPFFLYIFLSNFKKKHVFPCLLSAILGILPSLLYAGVGVWQFGYRYALDIYPFLFILLALSFARGIPHLAKILIVWSIAFNLFLMGSIWGVYPI